MTQDEIDRAIDTLPRPLPPTHHPNLPSRDEVDPRPDRAGQEDPREDP